MKNGGAALRTSTVLLPTTVVVPLVIFSVVF
jgi:hypothetical protein